MRLKRYMCCLPLLAMPASLMAADVLVSADITTNTTWTADTTYILRETIFVKNGATLIIEPGTLILGDNGPGPNSVIDNGGDDTYGSLVITRGSKIDAEGTKDKPIVFTAIEERDGIGGNPNNKPDPEKGDGGFWGGIILLGAAPINNYVDGTNANENDIEGFPGGSTEDITYGGNRIGDSSGIMTYVSIRFGGYVFNAATGSEINGLTLGGVGNNTVLENIEIISNTDDGLEIFGGTVNTKRIAVAFCQDDSFDLDEGHQGFHQFWFAIQNADSTIGDRGGEWDGGNGSTKNGTPFNTIRVYNMTLIGNGTDVTSPNPGFFITDNFAGQVHNSVVHDFGGPAITVGSLGNSGAPLPRFFNTTWGNFVGGPGELATYSALANGNSGIGTDPKLGGISRKADGKLDPRPASGSPLLGNSLSAFPSDAPKGFFETVNHRGAFGEDNWLDGWSWLSQAGYLPAAVDPSAPVFTTEPTPVVASNNAKVVLKSSATADGEVAYQWYRNGKAIKTGTSASYAIGKVNKRTAGNYYVVATLDGEFSTQSKTVSVQVAKLTTPKVAKAKVGKKYKLAIKSNFKASSYKAINLPKGLKINNKGVITGTPTAKGKTVAEITATRKVGKTTTKAVSKITFQVS